MPNIERYLQLERKLARRRGRPGKPAVSLTMFPQGESTITICSSCSQIFGEIRRVLSEISLSPYALGSRVRIRSTTPIPRNEDGNKPLDPYQLRREIRQDQQRQKKPLEQRRLLGHRRP